MYCMGFGERVDIYTILGLNVYLSELPIIVHDSCIVDKAMQWKSMVLKCLPSKNVR